MWSNSLACAVSSDGLGFVYEVARGTITIK